MTYAIRHLPPDYWINTSTSTQTETSSTPIVLVASQRRWYTIL